MISPGGRPLLLVYRALGLGDLLTAVPALRGLARVFTDHHRVLATAGALAPLALHTDTIDEVLPVGELEPLPPEASGPAIAVNLHGRGPQSHRVIGATHPARLIAFHHPSIPQTIGSPRWREAEHEVHRWCRLLQESGVFADPSELDVTPPPGGPPGTEGATLIHPGAASAARRWPPERWAEVARYEARRGVPVVISAGPSEHALGAHVAKLAGTGSVLFPEHAIGLASAVASAGRVVCGDTGVAHLATALHTPSVVVFGPVPPAQWGPPPERGRHRVLWAGLTGDPHAARPHEGLLRIRVEDVLDAMEELQAYERSAGETAPIMGGRRWPSA